MTEKTSSNGMGYVPGLIFGLIVGGGLFWLTIKMLIAQRP